MYVKKNKIIIAITVIVVALVIIGDFIAPGICDVLISSKQTSLSKGSKYSDSFVKLAVIDNPAISDVPEQSVYGNTNDENVKILVKENKILNIVAILFCVIVVECILVFFYLFKLKKRGYAAQILRDEEIRYFTYTDQLTKLPNRNGIKNEMTEWLEYCRKNAQNGGVIFLDIDNFQSVNNGFGCKVGDEFLEEVALQLTQLKGKKNITGRIDGDKFILLVSGVNTVEELEKYAEQTLELFKEPFTVKGNIIQLTVSIGAILFNCGEEKSHNDEFEKIVNRGEAILKKAKRLSRGSYSIFNDEFGRIIENQNKMEYELKNSINNNELTCYFQPLYDNEEKSIVGFESLARWKSSKFGMVSPIQFIEIAEQTGFIKELGRFVIDQTFAFAKSVQSHDLRISFNTSPIELLQDDYTDYVIKCFDYYGLTSNSVAIEVTESCLIDSFDKVIKKLKVLGDHGIIVYLDDFGTGFSSLTYLKNLPIHAVKIDKSFIDEIVTNKTEKDIVDMIVGLAHRLDFEVIAEGVETKEQINCVSNCGCNITQGYLISKPVPSEEAKRLLGVIYE